MAGDHQTTRRAFLAGSAAVPLAAYAAYRHGSDPGSGSSSDTVTVVNGPSSPATAMSAPTGASAGVVQPAAATTPPAATLYARPLHFTYARQDVNKASPKPIVYPMQTYTDAQIITKFKSVLPNKLTTVMPFFLNVRDLTGSANIIALMAQENFTIFPAVGGDPDGDGLKIDDIYFKQIVDVYRAAGFDCIRLENLQGYYDHKVNNVAWGRTPIDNLIDYCIQAGFAHIMLNPWPRDAAKQLLPFYHSQIDATMFQVLLDRQEITLANGNKTNIEIPDQPSPEPAGSTNWQAGNETKISQVLAFQPSTHIIINYEALPQHQVLYNREMTYGDSKGKMQITVTDCINKQRHWMPPWTAAYDPVSPSIATWNWVSTHLGAMT